MNQDAAGTQSPASPRRRWPRVAAAALLVAVVLLIALRVLLQPDRSVPMLLDRLGTALGLQITASGTPSFSVRGTPTLVVRGLDAREPGAPRPLLTADRIVLAVPWATIRERGATLDLTRIELDAPVLDLEALRHWMSGRPPGESRVPSLREGLHVRNGRLVASGWSVHDLWLVLPALHRDGPVRAQVRGRFVDSPTSIPFDLAVAMNAPGVPAILGVTGTLELQRPEWRMPMQVTASGPLRRTADGAMRVSPAHIAIAAEHVTADRRLPFVLGIHGPVQYRDGVTVIGTAGLALRGEAPLPRLEAKGVLAIGRNLVLRLAGTLQEWPASWPALPQPVGSSTSPLPFTLDYAGRADLADVARLDLRRDDVRITANFHLPEMQAWTRALPDGTPLPPLTGTATLPRMEISGATLEGVEIDIEEPGVPPPGARP